MSIFTTCLTPFRGKSRKLFSFSQKNKQDTIVASTFKEKRFSESTSSSFGDIYVDRPTTIAVLGVGYVGLHLVQAFGNFFNVIAFDKSEKRVADLKRTLHTSPLITLTSREEDLSKADFYLIAVPTLVTQDGPDFSPLQNALSMVAKYARPGSCVVIESSVGVGTTRKLLGPILLKNHLKGGMSPERVDPGRVAPLFEDIPKIISGLDDIAPGSLASIRQIYSQVFRTVHCVSKPEVAEMCKLYENCQRMVCIAYSNEIADACVPQGIDPYEVFSAASTKPFGYLPVKSGLGIGGHCIPVNPHYLFQNCDLPLLKEATQTVAERPTQIAKRLVNKLQSQRSILSRRPLRVLVIGVGFKRGEASLAYSPALGLLQSLVEEWNAEAWYADPLVPAEAVTVAAKLKERDWTKEKLETFDLVVLAVRQPGLDYTVLEGLLNPVVEYFD